MKRYITTALIIGLFILTILSVFKTCKRQTDIDHYQNIADSLRYDYNSLQTKYECLSIQYSKDTMRIIGEYQIFYVEKWKEAEKFKKIIADLRKLSQDSAHSILKKEYTPVEALVRIKQADSCEVGSKLLNEMLNSQIILNKVNTVHISNLNDIIDSFMIISDNCINSLSGCGDELQTETQKNSKLKRWCKGLGITAVASILFNLILIQ
jgi:hypothetical protein